MKPVNLNQLLLHPEGSTLSLFLSKNFEQEGDSLLEVLLADLEESHQSNLRIILMNHLHEIKSLVKKNSSRLCCFYFSQELVGYTILGHAATPFYIIDQTFHVRPILEEIFLHPVYLLVNISLYDVKIYRADFRQIEMIENYEFENLPQSFSQFRAQVYAPAFKSIIAHRSLMALKTIAEKLTDKILYESAPVIITGLDEMKSYFVKNLGPLPGIIDHFNEDFYEKSCIEIFERSRVFRFAVTDYYSAQLKERLKRLMKSGQTLVEIKEIIRACQEGQIAHLVIPSEQKIWGKFNLLGDDFILHKKRSKTSVDLINELAKKVINQGGKVQILAPHFFPENAPILALHKRNI